MAKLGSRKRPVIVRVQSPERAEEIARFCGEYGWHFIVGMEPDKPEDISDVEKLLSRDRARVREYRPPLAPRVSPNDYCPCGSGKKFKKCCGVS